MEIKSSKPGIARSVSENRAIAEANREKAPQSANASAAAPSSPASSSAAAKLLELKEGQIIKGQILDLRYNEVRIQLKPDGQTVTARLAGNVPLSIGEEAHFEVTESTKGKLVIKYLPESTDAQSEPSALNATIAKALKASGFSPTERNKAIVAELLTHRMPVDKQTLQTLIKAAVTDRSASPQSLVLMYQKQLPLTPANVRQFEAYQNGTGQLLKDIKAILGTIHGLLPSGTELSSAGGKLSASGTGLPAAGEELSSNSSGLPAAEAKHTANEYLLRLNASLYQLLEANSEDVSSFVLGGRPEVKSSITDNVPSAAQSTVLPNGSAADSMIANGSNADGLIKDSLVTGSLLVNGSIAEDLAAENHILNSSGAVSTDMESLRQNSTAKAKDVLSLLQKALPLMREEEAGKLLTSLEYHSLLEQSFHDKWTITPERLAEKASVKELYRNIREDMDRLSTLIKTLREPEEALRLQEPVKNLQESLQFMRDLSTIVPYIQLPIQLKDQDVHGELYVFARKKAASAAENTSVLLHLEMESLGSMNIRLQLDHNILRADFYMEQAEAEHMVKEHMPDLTEALAKKGYSLHSMVTGSYQKPDLFRDFTIDSQAAAGNVNRYTFDIRT